VKYPCLVYDDEEDPPTLFMSERGVLSCSRLLKNAARMARIIQSPIEHDDPQLACDHEQVGAHVVGD
jgi:hypothetical protein